MNIIKILNLYAGLGGNRKLWGNDYDITAIEINPEIAKIYQDFFPNDKVIVTDAHQYLLEHFKEFDFIWSSIPCQSHSRARFWGANGGTTHVIYPDMKLYQEILLLKHYFKGKWLIENVIPFYEFLISPDRIIGRHAFWSNIIIPPGLKFKENDINKASIDRMQKLLGIDISKYKIKNRKDQILRNCVNPKLGLFLFQKALNIQAEENIPQGKLDL